MERLPGRGRGDALGFALLRLSTYGNDVAYASGDAGIRQLQMAGAGGVRYLHGGWQTLISRGRRARNVSRLLGDGCVEVARWAEAARPATVESLDVGLDVEWGDAATFALTLDDPLYLSVHAPVARLAPPGHTLVHVMRYHRPDVRAGTASCDRSGRPFETSLRTSS